MCEPYNSLSRCHNKFPQERLFTPPSHWGRQTGFRKGWHATRLSETRMTVKTKTGPAGISDSRFVQACPFCLSGSASNQRLISGSRQVARFPSREVSRLPLPAPTQPRPRPRRDPLRVSARNDSRPAAEVGAGAAAPYPSASVRDRLGPVAVSRPKPGSLTTSATQTRGRYPFPPRELPDPRNIQ